MPLILIKNVIFTLCQTFKGHFKVYKKFYMLNLFKVYNNTC